MEIKDTSWCLKWSVWVLDATWPDSTWIVFMDIWPTLASKNSNHLKKRTKLPKIDVAQTSQPKNNHWPFFWSCCWDGCFRSPHLAINVTVKGHMLDLQRGLQQKPTNKVFGQFSGRAFYTLHPRTCKVNTNKTAYVHKSYQMNFIKSYLPCNCV